MGLTSYTGPMRLGIWQMKLPSCFERVPVVFITWKMLSVHLKYRPRSFIQVVKKGKPNTGKITLTPQISAFW